MLLDGIPERCPADSELLDEPFFRHAAVGPQLADDDAARELLERPRGDRAAAGRWRGLQKGLLFNEVHTAPPSASSETARSEEHTSEIQTLIRSSYAVFCL